MKKVMKKRAGFTLVELLIVIIIIGILAGAMLLVAGSGTDKAEATKIISNLRSAKAAALMKWADDGNWTFLSNDVVVNTELKKYMDRELPDTYKFGVDITSGDVYSIKTKVPTDNIGAKLANVAKDSGLFSNAPCTTVPTTLAKDAEVFMRVR